MSTAQQTTTETIRELLSINKILKKFIDLQSERIDMMSKRLDMIEAREDLTYKIFSKYQMTEGNEISEGRKDQDLIDKKWREVSELGI